MHGHTCFAGRAVFRGRPGIGDRLHALSIFFEWAHGSFNVVKSINSRTRSHLASAREPALPVA
eukprot:364582-Chlamydomonas_euryale.AAC.3